MVGINRIGQSKPFLCLLLALAMLCVLEAAAQAGTITSCSGCHGMPPVDAPYRNISTGGFAGNHLTHLASPAAAADCSKCHDNAGYISSHRDGKIQFSANINTSPAPGGGQYKLAGVAITFKNQSSVPVAGSCSNVNCHFEAITPTWGSAYFGYTSPTVNDCGQCHGAPPSGSNGAAGSHAKHDTYFPGANNCVKCHSDHTAESSKFSHATSAGHRNLVLQLRNAADVISAGSAYTGPVNDYLPSQTNVFGNCTNLYCHSNGQKALGNFSTNTVPTWGTPLPANCTGCHRADNASGTIMKSGSHDKHVNIANLNTISCGKCHAATVSASSMTIIDPSSHVNAKVSIKFNSLTTAVNGTYGGQPTPYSKDPGTAYGQCTNVYCHSTIQSGATGTGAPTYRTPTWGNAGSGACGTCHDGDNGHTFGAVMATGSHTAHLSQSYSGTSNVMKCVICHNISGQTMALGAGCDSTFCHNSAPAKHANGRIDVLINPLFGASGVYNGSTVPRAGFNSCSNVSCHFNTTTPTWGTATPITCVGCHTLAQLMASGAHSKHISNSLIPTMYNYTANRSTAGEYNFGCSNCHPLDVANHMNGFLNVTLKKDEAGIGTLRTKNSATAVGIGVAGSGITGTTKVSIICSAAYCHSNGNVSNLVYATTPNWYGGSFTGDRCANCHGNSPNSTIPGSSAHYNNKFLGYTSTQGGHQVGIHAFRVYSSGSGLATAGTGGDTTHGNDAVESVISCYVCHNATVTAKYNDNNTICIACHYSGNSLGAHFGNAAAIADKSRHVNGKVDVVFKNMTINSKAQLRNNRFTQAPYSSIWRRDFGYKVPGAHDTAKVPLNTATMWDGSTKTCSNIACHNGQTVKWSDTNGTTTCISCHTAL